jgi:hypothetical protein
MHDFSPLKGKGAYALVKEAIHLLSGHKVAIKVYEKDKLTNL